VSAATLLAVLVGTDVDRGAPRPRVAGEVGGQAAGVAFINSGTAGLEPVIASGRVDEFGILAKDVVGENRLHSRPVLNFASGLGRKYQVISHDIRYWVALNISDSVGTKADDDVILDRNPRLRVVKEDSISTARPRDQGIVSYDMAWITVDIDFRTAIVPKNVVFD